MARYRTKDSTDLQWNAIRRRITREADTQIAEWREEYLNHMLGRAWERYAEQLDSGEVVAVRPQFEQFIGVALSQVIDVEPKDRRDAAMADRKTP